MMQKIDKEQFIKDIKDDLGIEERKYNDYNYSKIGINDFGDLDAIFKSFFNVENRGDAFKNSNNICVKCKLNKKEAIIGCEKIIEIKRCIENNKYKKVKIKVKIPSNIRDGQKIIIRGEGNRNKGCIGNLVINVELK